jgi:DNA polymerase III subunit delta
LAHEILEKHKLNMETRDLGILLDAVGADAMRLANEVEKLSIFAGPGGKVTGEDVRALVVNASESTIFGLVNALGRRDRAAALASLDLLVRDGEYLPLALTFLGTEFRLALVVHDLHFKNFQQVLNHFSRQGVRMWRHRAEQLVHTASVFGADELRRGIKLIYEADKGLRDTRPDDRTVMEKLVVDLTG